MFPCWELTLLFVRKMSLNKRNKNVSGCGICTGFRNTWISVQEYFWGWTPIPFFMVCLMSQPWEATLYQNRIKTFIAFHSELSLASLSLNWLPWQIFKIIFSYRSSFPFIYGLWDDAVVSLLSFWHHASCL